MQFLNEKALRLIHLFSITNLVVIFLSRRKSFKSSCHLKIQEIVVRVE